MHTPERLIAKERDNYRGLPRTETSRSRSGSTMMAHRRNAREKPIVWDADIAENEDAGR